MPKHIPDEIKLKAMELFLKGDKTAKQIAEEISTEEHAVSPPTIYMWAKKDKWGEQKAVAIADKQSELAETEGQRFARLQATQLDGYTEIANKATREMTELHFDRALDAARAADIGIKGQREVLQGMINMEFVQDIMSVLIEEISDNETLQRIGIKLKAIEQKHRDI
jgi:transposase-like protein